MKILVFNAGSSSLKFGIFDLSLADSRIFKGEFEHFTDNGCNFNYRVGGISGESHSRSASCLSVAQAVNAVPDVLEEFGFSSFDAIGHRVVHGGRQLAEPAVINATVFQTIQKTVPLAPLHNPDNLLAIKLSQQLWPDTPQVAVFDTGYHQTIPEYAYSYAIPKRWRELGVRRYGFHGTSHKYIAEHAARALGKPLNDLRLISCHLGNGASLCAITGGSSVDTSMGMTSLEGLVMGTRSGDVDPGLFAFLQRELAMDAQQIEAALYKESGLRAIAGVADMRTLEKLAGEGNADAQLAIAMFVYRVRKYIGAYAAQLSGVDAIIFTGGIGVNSVMIRQRCCEGLDFMGVMLDVHKNAALNVSGQDIVSIAADRRSVNILVTRTQEQYMIAREVRRTLEGR